MSRFLAWIGQIQLLTLVSLVAGFTPRVDADIVINEVLASNRTTNLDQFHSSSDWAEILNTGPDPVDLTGYWLSDDPESPLKWQFPILTLAPGEHRVVWCSGEDQTVADAAFLETQSKIQLKTSYVTTETEWSYLTDAPGAPAPPADWYQPPFDDAGWSTGKPPFGAGDHQPAAVPAELQTVTPLGNNVVLLRARFTVDDPTKISTLIWRASYDDGFVLYLNGARLLDVAYDGSDPTFDTAATSPHGARESSHFDISMHRGLLRPGENVVAVALLNATGDDIFLLPELGEIEPLLHTSFQLSSGGESVVLSDPAGNPIDTVVFPEQATDRSYGRSPDGNGDFFFMLEPTPAAANTDLVSASILPNDVEFTPESGVFEDQVSVVLSTSLPFDAVEIRFTTDGQAPDTQSTVYQQRIQITKDTIIRAAVFLGQDRVTSIVTKGFFVSELAGGLSLPIMSIAMAPDDFSDVHLRRYESGVRSERPAHMQIFDAQGVPVAATGFGLRLHGGAGRAGEINLKKAYRAYFRRIYGAGQLKYPVIPGTEVSSFDKLVLRSGFNDSFRQGPNASLIRDQLVRDLHEEMGGLVSHGGWYNIFVNGKYRGLYNVVERIDRQFFESYFPEAKDGWDIIRPGAIILRLRFYQTVLDGNADVWREMLSFLLERGLEPNDHYKQATKLLDVSAITSYMIANIWAQNGDWPHNNWYAARPQGEPGRWFFLAWDAEAGLGLSPTGHTEDSFNRVVGVTQGEPRTAIVFSALLRNRGYQEFFLNEFDRYLAGTLSPENVHAHIDRLATLIEPDVPEEASITGGSFRSWQLAVSEMRTFASVRNRVIRDYVMHSEAFSVPVVIGVRPTRLVQFGPTEVTVKTRNVTGSAQVFFNDVPAKKVVPGEDGDLLVTLPFDRRLAGTPTIRLASDNREVTASNLLTVSFPRAEITAIVPPVGFPAGGDVVKITGSNLTASARVEFGAREAPSVRRVDNGAALLVVTPPGEGVVEVRVMNTRPHDLEPLNTVTFTYSTEVEAGFVRGDADRSGLVGISDAVAILRHVTGLSAKPPCEAALDADDSDVIDVSDAIFLVNFLFRLQAQPPPAPFPACGLGNTGNGSLTCLQPMACP